MVAPTRGKAPRAPRPLPDSEAKAATDPLLRISMASGLVAKLFVAEPPAPQLAARAPSHSWQSEVPAWLVSLLIHMLLVVLLGYRMAPPQKGTGVLRQTELLASLETSQRETRLFDDAADEPASAPAMQLAAGGPASLADVFDEAPLDPASALPSTELPAAPNGDRVGSATGATGMTQGGAGRPGNVGKLARTSVYGVVGEGETFVYVFDRSGSMGGGGDSPLAAAKAQLLASLEDLGQTHRFQIIFYNQEPTIMNIPPAGGALVFATEQNKLLARRFVASIAAAGGTEHEAALTMALKLRPDVIFFLTDADEPVMTPVQLARIARRNGGRTSIHTIEFGVGPPARRDNFLRQLAHENGGQYVYVDVTRAKAPR